MATDEKENIFDSSVLNGIETSVLRKAGIDVSSPSQLLYNEKFKKIMQAALDWSAFAEVYFCSPDDVEAPLLLEEWQRDIIRYSQYGEKKYMVLVCPRGFGKSIVTSCIAAVIAIVKPGFTIGLYAMGQKQSTDLLEKIRFFITNSPFSTLLPKRGTGLANNSERIQLLNGSDIRAYPCTEGIRGTHNHVVIIDEASRVSDKMINETIRPTGRRKGIREIDLSTPAGMTGEFWRSFQDTEMYHVTKVGALEVSWMTPEKLAEEEKRLGPFAAKQELYAEFIPTGDTLISPEWIKGSYEIHGYRRTKFDLAFINESGRNMVMGADFGRDSDRTVFAIGHKNQYGVYQLDYMESILKAPYPVIVTRLVTLCKQYNVRLVVPDATGLGEPIVDMINKEAREREIGFRMFSNSKKKKREGFIFSHESKMDLLNELMRIYAEGLISVPFHQNNEDHESLHLERELLSFEFKIENTGSARPSIRFGTQSSHDDRIIGISLMLFGLIKQTFTYTGMRTYGASKSLKTQKDKEYQRNRIY
jgi:hypothetical protein